MNILAPDILPFALLAAALVLFWVSTRQFAWQVRALFWIGAAALLVAATMRGMDFARSRDSFSVALSALGSDIVQRGFAPNWQTVAQSLPSMLALFVLLTGVLALITLIALSPGDLLERVARPLVVGLFGAIAGALLSLTALTLGFGGYLKPRAYIFLGDQIEPVDGDTFKIGDVALRLEGIDALESDQVCVGGRVDCGVAATERVVQLLRGAVVICTRADQNEAALAMPPEESFGRPLVTCTAQTAEGRDDVGARMIEDGFAVAYIPPRDHVPDVHAYADGCSTLPRDWRRMSAEERSTFPTSIACRSAAAAL